MNYDQANEIFKTTSSTRCQAQWRDMIDKALVYARVRVDWLRANTESQAAMGARRTALHNAFITSCNTLALAMTATGEDASWRKQLGKDRKIIGDFACFVHCILGQMAR